MSRKQLWGGRFAEGPARSLKRFNDSFSVDSVLLAEELEASKAWCEALREANVLTDIEARRISQALGEMEQMPIPVSASQLEGDDHEDVHSFVEAVLAEKIGDLAGKLHTGRSRNDQVATDLKLYLRKAFETVRELALDLADSLAVKAAREAGTAMPGYTHLQQGEPVTFGHWCLAYVEMLLRDVDRITSAAARNEECPLGSGALSGTPLQIDRDRLATTLGFARPTANSLDAVADRDGAIEFLFCSSMLLVHLSRLSEDLIFFATQECRYVLLSDATSTGSSRMPHKKNPDVLELTRGHAARAIGELTGLLSLMKGLPLAYNKDMQLDKEAVFRTFHALQLALPALIDLLDGLTPDRERMRAAASQDTLLATELADALARRGVPFRDAHHVVSEQIGKAFESQTSLRALGTTRDISQTDLEALDVDRALGRRSSAGGTSPSLVSAAAVKATKQILELRRLE
ncbi:MAG TPA: argininosuccinate lyase [Thermoanaerobaculia bacterium]|nr:argininosuccinate lyase [Thermoanaerobaculia bacterium]